MNGCQEKRRDLQLPDLKVHSLEDRKKTLEINGLAHSPPNSVSVESEKDDEEDDDEEAEEKTLLARIKLIAPHVALLLVTWLYTIIGASVFYYIEQPNEIELKNKSLEQLNDLQSNFLRYLWNLSVNSNVNSTIFSDNALLEFDRVMEATFKAFQNGITAADIGNGIVELDWTFYSAIFFTTTLITTIGYGNLVPSTFLGRLFCIFYAMLGIPLTLVTIADIGKFVSSFIIWTWENIEKFSGILWQKLRTILKNQRSMSSRKLYGEQKKSSTIQQLLNHVDGREGGGAGTGTNSMRDGDENDNFNILVTNGENKQRSRRDSSATSFETESEDSSDMEEEFEAMPVPQSFVVLTLLSYTALGALMFCEWENWTFVDSFYFCLITMTTVGFGDLVPVHESYLMLAIVFIFVGLVLATMCIDTVGSHYIRKLHYFGRKIQGAHQVLAMIGGKALTLGDWMKHMKRVQKTFNLTDEEMRRMMLSPEEYINFLEQQQKKLMKPFSPHEAEWMRYIDHNTEPSPRSSQTSSSSRSRSSYDNVVKRTRKHVVQNL